MTADVMISGAQVSSPKAKRIEFRCPDATANPYLAFSAMLLAGIDGIQKGLDPGAPSDYDLFEDAEADVPQVPGSRIVTGGFQKTSVAIAVAKDHPQGLAFVSSWLSAAKRDGTVARIFAAHGFPNQPVASD